MGKNFNKCVLVAPLDWGLGHTTRCIPLIKALKSLGCSVILAGEGVQQKLLQQEFPNDELIFLKGYRISYTNNKRLFAFKIAWQLPKILISVYRERRWLKKIILEHNINAVISDNRYGLWNSSVPTVFITHQLQIKAPISPIERVIRYYNYKFINRFAECWVPDAAGSINIAGTLSHPGKLPRVPVKYLGGISRLNLNTHTNGERNELMVVISGPEPQRTFLEKGLLKQLASFHEPVLFVRGLPGDAASIASFNKVTIANHLTAVEMETAFNNSNYIISRSGYTTVMDILKLRKKSILIPTPGQTEQEYLADHLQQQHVALAFAQHDFDLQAALKKARDFNFEIPALNFECYKMVLKEWVAKLTGEDIAGKDA